MKDETQRLEIYKNCMKQIKERIALTDQSLTEWREKNVATTYSCEAAALQLRKIYELIAFSAMSADLEKYSSVRMEFSEDWRFADILKTIEQENRYFLPQPTRRVQSTVEGVNWHIEERPEAKLSKEDLIFRYKQLHKIMHAENPFAEPYSRHQYLIRIDTWVREVGGLLAEHRYVIGPMQQGYIVELNDHGEDVTAFRVDLVG